MEIELGVGLGLANEHKHKMVGVKVYKSIKDHEGTLYPCELMEKFVTMRDAAVYINEISEAKLNRRYSHSYISKIISKPGYGQTISFFSLIDIVAERSNKCVECECKFYSMGVLRRCDDCSYDD